MCLKLKPSTPTTFEEINDFVHVFFISLCVSFIPSFIFIFTFMYLCLIILCVWSKGTIYFMYYFPRALEKIISHSKKYFFPTLNFRALW